MSFLATIGSVIKGTYKGIKANLIAVENPRYGIEIAKKKVVNFFKTIGKVFLYQILSYALILVIVIAAVGIVFEMFAFFKNLTNPFDINAREMDEWADELSKEEIEEMQEYGASIHPQKVSKYIEIEDNSYSKNVTIRVPIVTNDNGEVTTEYVNYNLNRGDTAYPYRQWWHSTATLDAINDTAINKRNLKIIKGAKKDLKPIFIWGDPKMESYKDGKKYTPGNNLYEFVEVKTIEISGGEDEESSYTETTKTYPLPYLTEVTTMFAKYKFNYSKKVDTTSYSVKRKNGSTKTITTTTSDYELVDIEKEYVDNFFKFLNKNNIDTNSDPEVMYFMAEQMPQNYDFLSEFEEYLYYMNDMALYGEFRGGFGGYEGKYEILPSDLVRDIPLFLQGDSRWANVPYSYTNNKNHGTIASSGCGPTSAAMVVTGLGGYNEKIDLNGDGIIDPYETAMYSLKKSHRVYGQGTSWAFFADIGNITGLNVYQKSPKQYKDVLDALQKGNPVVASMGPGVFTKGGHYITLVGINENGKVIVNDPNSTNRSNAAWNFYNPILAQAKQFWIFSK